MRNQQSFETEGGDINERSASQTNLGLINLATKGVDRPQFNWLEVVTFILIIVAALYCAKIWCKGRVPPLPLPPDILDFFEFGKNLKFDDPLL